MIEVLYETIRCPKCSTKATKLLDDIKILECPNEECKFKFYTIICIHCFRPIYYKSSSHYYLFDSANIKCPYSDCNKYFFQSQCPNPKCQQIHRFANKMDTYVTINCNNCFKKYLKIRCPIKGCGMFHNIENDIEDQNNYYPNGIKMKHFKKLITVISCYKCNNLIYYISPSKYFEGQRITCPYENCKAIFHRLVCPQRNCRNINIVNSYEFGEKITCNQKNCMKSFSKMHCPFCTNSNIFIQKNHTGGFQIKCKVQSCLRYYDLINCTYCRRTSIYCGYPVLPGQPTICGYEDCKKVFYKITCPSCKNLNILDSIFPLGRTIKCNYQNCNVKFKAIICPGCRTVKFNKKKILYGYQLSCQRCKREFINAQCPFCKLNILEDRSTLREMQMIQCPNQKCKRLFSMTLCSNCKNTIYSQENTYIENTPLKCNDPECKALFVNLNCPNCNCLIHNIRKTESFHPHEVTKCTLCNTQFIPYDSASENRQLGLYNGNLRILEPIKGFPLPCGEGIKSYNTDELFNHLLDLQIYNKSMFIEPSIEERKLKFSSNLYSSIKISSCITSFSFNKLSSYNEIGELCPICNNGTKESVFIPCGHRCTCYYCAEKILKTTKKCYKCQEPVSKVIKKVYD